MKKSVLFFIVFLAVSSAFSADYGQLIAKTSYSAGEKEQIAQIFRNAEKKNLSAELLANKLKEAMTKKVRFNLLFVAMNQRAARMAEADAIITEKKLSVKNRQHATQVLTDLLEKGFKRSEFEKLLDAVAGKNKDFDDSAKYFDALGKYQSKYVNGEHYADILAACVNKGVSAERGEKMLYVFTEAVRNDMPVNTAKELLLQGIAQNRRLEEISSSIQQKGSSKPRDSETENDRRGNIQDRGYSGDGGKSETGGGNPRNGR